MHHIINGPKVTWIDIQQPNSDDIAFLKTKHNFHPMILSELIPVGHRPRIEYYKNYIYIILYYPIYNKDTRETKPRELNILITKNTLITVHHKSIIPLKALFDQCNVYPEKRKKYMNWSPGFLLFNVLDSFWKNCLVKLDRIDERIEHIEKEIFKGKEKEMVKEISVVKTDVINFSRIVEPQGSILESLEKDGPNFFGEKLYPYFSDILGTYGQAIDSLKEYKETLKALEDTNHSLLSTKTNEIIRVLTVFSIILLPLTLIASMWGMNTVVPLQHKAEGFIIMAGVMFVIMIIQVLYFRSKKWL